MYISPPDQYACLFGHIRIFEYSFLHQKGINIVHGIRAHLQKYVYAHIICSWDLGQQGYIYIYAR
mgnify:CR=1 FL=1